MTSVRVKITKFTKTANSLFALRWTVDLLSRLSSLLLLFSRVTDFVELHVIAFRDICIFIYFNSHRQLM